MRSVTATEDDRGANLIDAAYAVLEEGGLDSLTVRAVLQRTGLARRAFYDRFSGKDDLVLAVIQRQAECVLGTHEGLLQKLNSVARLRRARKTAMRNNSRFAAILS